MKRRSWSVAVAVVVASFGVVVACSNGDDGSPTPASTCPNDLPSACTDPPPSYSNSIAAILDARCNHCHGPGGNAAEKPLTDYASVARFKSSSLNQVYACRMPPAGSPSLSPTQRAKLLMWFVCGAPND